MIFFIKNSSDTYWIPIYFMQKITFHNIPFLFFTFITFVLIFLTGFITCKSCQIILNFKCLHTNMTIFICCCFLQWFEVILAKMVLISYQIGVFEIGEPCTTTQIDWWTDDVGKMIKVADFASFSPIFVAGFLTWHYTYSILFAVVTSGIERLLATYYIRDYEEKSRLFIPITLLIISQTSAISFSMLVTTNTINFNYAIIVCFSTLILIIILYSTVWIINIKYQRRIVYAANPTHYSLSIQFQVKENLRCVKIVTVLLSAGLIFCGIFLGLLVILVSGIFHNNEAFFAYFIEICIHFNPLIMCTALMFATRTWKSKFLKNLPFLRRFVETKFTLKPIKKVTAENEAKIYFDHLKNSWN